MGPSGPILICQTVDITVPEGKATTYTLTNSY
jgi:hypothetical protein